MAIDSVLESMERAADRSAAYLVSVTSSTEQLKTWKKPDHTVVMEIDLESERLLLEDLQPLHPCVSEENEGSHALLSHARDFFVVDPLDGTASCKRFMRERGGQLGFGPLLGFVLNRRLQASVFYHIPLRTLFTAVRGRGCWSVARTPGDPLPPLTERSRLSADDCSELSNAGVVFFPGRRGELPLVQTLKLDGIVENVYRFGGFANDCTRLARGFEQIGIQYSVRAWDFAAVLFPAEAGVEVCLDPMGTRTEFDNWEIGDNNPVLMYSPGLRNELFKLLDQACE